MSISRKPDDPDRGFHEETANLLGDGYGETRGAARDLLRKYRQIDFLAHYTRGHFDFSLDPVARVERARHALQRLGRQVVFQFGTLDRALRPVRTGALIRAVLHTASGALVCNSVVPREFVFAICSEAAAPPRTPLTAVPDVRAADRGLAELTSRLRELIRLPSLNHGGWESADEVRALTVADPAGALVVARDGDEPAAELVADCVAAVRPEDLHFVAYCAGGELRLSADHLAHRSLRPFFTQVDTGERREFYREFSRQLGGIVVKLNRVLTEGEPGGLLLRVVLDVEQGAIYFYRLGPDSYLVGVTLDQDRVSGADERLAEVAARHATG